MSKSRKQQRWTTEEILILKDNYNKDYDVLENLFPNRSLKSIRHKINGLGLPREKQYYTYTKEEDDILRENSMRDQEEILELLPNRSWESITQRISKLGLDRQKSWSFWSKDEESIVLKFDTIEDMKEFLPNRTESQIYSKAVKMGVRFDNPWSEYELAILKENYGKTSLKNFIHLFNKRSYASVYTKANKMGLEGAYGKMGDIPNDLIIELVRDGHYKAEIANLTGLTDSAIRYRLEQLEITVPNKIFYGEESPAWKGGITAENTRIRGQKEYRHWRDETYKRDNYTCQCCGDDTGGNLHAHHIYNFSEHEEIRFELWNAMTMCDKCHSFQIIGSFHHTYGTRNNDIYQLQEYFDDIRSHLGLPLISIESIINKTSNT